MVVEVVLVVTGAELSPPRWWCLRCACDVYLQYTGAAGAGPGAADSTAVAAAGRTPVMCIVGAGAAAVASLVTSLTSDPVASEAVAGRTPVMCMAGAGAALASDPVASEPVASEAVAAGRTPVMCIATCIAGAGAALASDPPVSSDVVAGAGPDVDACSSATTGAAAGDAAAGAEPGMDASSSAREP